MKQKIFGITGWKNAGKTTLTEQLVHALCKRGYSVSTIKHAHHNFDIDKQGTDSYRHREAGAREVAIVSYNRWALMHELNGADEPSLDEILARMQPCDLIIIEGYKSDKHPKIEVRRKDSPTQIPLDAEQYSIKAIASDEPIKAEGVPVFDLNNIAVIADFVENFCALQPDRSKPIQDRLF